MEMEHSITCEVVLPKCRDDEQGHRIKNCRVQALHALEEEIKYYKHVQYQAVPQSVQKLVIQRRRALYEKITYLIMHQREKVLE